MTTDWHTIGDQVMREINLLPAANITWDQFRARDRSSIMSFCGTVPDYGLDTTPGDVRDFLTSISDTGTLAGQSMIVSLSQGQNQAVLSAAGITTAIDIK